MFSKCVLFLFLLRFVLGYTQDITEEKIFRHDYTYIEAINSFIKFNTLSRTWNEAKKACEREGAMLYYPEEDGDIVPIKEHWENFRPYINWIFVNVTKNDFLTQEGLPKSGVYTHWDKGEPNDIGGNEECITLSKQGTINDENCNNKYPFMCIKTSPKIFNDCVTAYEDYKLSDTPGKCYKFHSTPRNWLDAYAICYGEQSYLTVIDDGTELAYLVDFINKTLEAIPSAIHAKAIHSGFFNMNGWTTIKGLPLHLSGYNKWGQSQPDGGISENCGAMAYDGLLQDIDCHQKMYFICEHEVTKAD